jgi:hypothetical protein
MKGTRAPRIKNFTTEGTEFHKVEEMKSEE